MEARCPLTSAPTWSAPTWSAGPAVGPAAARFGSPAPIPPDKVPDVFWRQTVITALERDVILAALIAADGPWDPAAVFVGVFVSVTDLGIETEIGDLVVPTGAPGVRQPVTTWSDPSVKGDGRALVTGPVMEFRPASALQATTVAGWYVADALTAGNLLTFGMFPDGPVPLPDETSSVDVVLRLVVDPENGEWTSTIVFNGTE